MLWLLIAIRASAAAPSLGGVVIGAAPPAEFRCYAVDNAKKGTRACDARTVQLGKGMRANVGLELCGKVVHKAVFSIVYAPAAGAVKVAEDPKRAAEGAASKLDQLLAEQSYALTPPGATSYRNATQAPWSVSVLTMQLSASPKIPIGSWQASAILQRDGACRE